MIPEAPGRAEGGFRTATTVARTKDRPPVSSSAARAWIERPADIRRCPFRGGWPTPSAWSSECRCCARRGATGHQPRHSRSWRRADGSRLADPLGADRMMRRWRDRLVQLPPWCPDRGRKEIVHERAGKVVAQLVVRDRLEERRGEAHREAAVDLAVHDHRVDDVFP